MLLSALLLPMLAATAPSAQSSPITVTGHAWAPFISPMGEPFRAHSPADDTLADWFREADRNQDGMLTAAELQADADRFFATLDTSRDGEIDPEELVQYEWEIAPDIQVMSRKRPAPGETRAKPRRSGAERSEEDAGFSYPHGLQGAARYALLNIPEPVAAADTNFDRGISTAEFRQAAALRFQLLDVSRMGNLTLAQLQVLRLAALASNRRTKHDDKAVDSRVGNPLPPGN